MSACTLRLDDLAGTVFSSVSQSGRQSVITGSVTLRIFTKHRRHYTPRCLAQLLVRVHSLRYRALCKRIASCPHLNSFVHWRRLLHGRARVACLSALGDIFLHATPTNTNPARDCDCADCALFSADCLMLTQLSARLSGTPAESSPRRSQGCQSQTLVSCRLPR
jgi:hypothetical protein